MLDRRLPTGMFRLRLLCPIGAVVPVLSGRSRERKTRERRVVAWAKPLPPLPLQMREGKGKALLLCPLSAKSTLRKMVRLRIPLLLLNSRLLFWLLRRMALGTSSINCALWYNAGRKLRLRLLANQLGGPKMHSPRAMPLLEGLSQILGQLFARIGGRGILHAPLKCLMPWSQGRNRLGPWLFLALNNVLIFGFLRKLTR